MRFLALFAGISILTFSLAKPLLAAEIPSELKLLAKTANPLGLEVQPGAGLRYDSLKDEHTKWIGGKVIAQPRKWLQLQGVMSWDVPGNSKPRAESSVFVRF